MSLDMTIGARVATEDAGVAPAPSDRAVALLPEAVAVAFFAVTGLLVSSTLGVLLFLR